MNGRVKPGWLALLFAAMVVARGARADEITVVSVNIDDRLTVISVETGPPINQIMNEIGDPAAVLRMMAEIEEMAETSQSVSMFLPPIDYGGEGNFAGVRISSRDGTSFDPQHFLDTGEEKYTGSVTITDFTEDVLAGSYFGKLYVAEHVEGQARPRVRKIGEASGWFRMAMPIMADSRFDRELPDAEAGRAEALALWDLMRTAGLGIQDMDRLDEMQSLSREVEGELGAREEAAPLPRAATDAELLQAPCLCECEYLAMLGEASPCHAQCRAEGLTCRARAPAGHDAELDAIIAELGTLGYPPDATAMMREMLADLPSDQRQMMLDMYKQSAPALQK